MRMGQEMRKTVQNSLPWKRFRPERIIVAKGGICGRWERVARRRRRCLRRVLRPRWIGVLRNNVGIVECRRCGRE
jgi:hypothetical protein